MAQNVWYQLRYDDSLFIKEIVFSIWMGLGKLIYIKLDIKYIL